MGFGMGYESIQMLLGALEIARPKKYRHSPDQRDGQRYRVAHACGVLDRLPSALLGLCGMAQQPPGSCQCPSCYFIESEIGQAGPLRARPRLYCRAELRTGTFKIARNVEGNPHEGMRQQDRRGIPDPCSNISDALATLQSSLKGTDSKMEHMQRA
jgi:hypothetical protein